MAAKLFLCDGTQQTEGLFVYIYRNILKVWIRSWTVFFSSSVYTHTHTHTTCKVKQYHLSLRLSNKHALHKLLGDNSCVPTSMLFDISGSESVEYVKKAPEH